MKKSNFFDYFAGFLGIPNQCSFQHPQEIIFQIPEPKPGQSESHTSNRHLQKISPKLDHLIKSCWILSEKSQNFPLCIINWNKNFDRKLVTWFMNTPSKAIFTAEEPLKWNLNLWKIVLHFSTIFYLTENLVFSTHYASFSDKSFFIRVKYCCDISNANFVVFSPKWMRWKIWGFFFGKWVEREHFW